MRLTRWTPNGNMLNLHDEVNRLFNDIVIEGELKPLLPAGWLPAVDLHETAEEYTVQMDLPGVNPKDLKIELLEGRLTIKGERKFESRPAEDGATARRLERSVGTFERVFRLPGRVDSGQVKASYNDGVLLVRVPKAPEAVGREIAIEVG
jgi:HSP20 family protein